MKFLLFAACLCPSVLATAAELPAGPVRSFTAQVLDARRRAIDIWPGFDLTKAPVLIHFPGAGTVLLDDAAPPEGFVRARPGVFFKPGRFDPTSARFEAHLPLGERFAFFFRYDLKAGDREEITLLVHEAFHKFQDTPRPAAERRALSADEAGRSAYASHIENIALFQALASPDRKSVV